MIINDHKLDDAQWSESPNTSGKFPEGRPESIVIHFTAGSSAKSSVEHLCKKSAKASAHLVIGREGEVYQLAPFDTITWHAGRSTWKNRSGLNKYSIGIELDNAGKLNDNGNGNYSSWFNKNYSGDEVFYGIHRNESEPCHWHAYTEAQLEKTFEICQLLCEQYGITQVLGHEEIAPGRKTDPGPAFPLERLRQQVLQTDDRQSDMASSAADILPEMSVVNASKLNIRNGPGSNFTAVTNPLLRGALLKPVKQQNGWTEVEYTVKGWVSSQYISKLG